jgi:hypothetical protein
MKEILNILSYEELKILIYKKKLKKLAINDDKPTYIEYLYMSYTRAVFSYSAREMIKKFNEISDENYEKYGDEYLQTATISGSFELEELLVNRMYELRPPQRKFNMVVATSTSTLTQPSFQCPICFDEIQEKDKIITNCNHTFCNNCVQRYLKSLNNSDKIPVCAYCRDPMKSLKITNPILCKQIQDKYCNPQHNPNPNPTPLNPPTNFPRYNTSFARRLFQFIGF